MVLDVVMHVCHRAASRVFGDYVPEAILLFFIYDPLLVGLSQLVLAFSLSLFYDWIFTQPYIPGIQKVAGLETAFYPE